MRGTFSGLCYYAGVHNVLDGMDIPYQSNLSEEKMLELNPELIITPSWDYSKKATRSNSVSAFYKIRPIRALRL